MAAMWCKRHLFVALMLGACAPRPAAAPPAVSLGVSPLQRMMVERHRAAREAAGVPPLAWDEGLAATATAYAGMMAQTGEFHHAEQPLGTGRQGENLFRGTRGGYSLREMIDFWTGEVRDFVDAPMPNFSRTGNWRDVGHYSQIVWRHSVRFGCGVASSAAHDYLVCRYYPAGNVINQRAL